MSTSDSSPSNTDGEEIIMHSMCDVPCGPECPPPRRLTHEEAGEILKDPRIGYLVEPTGVWNGNPPRVVRRNADGTVSWEQNSTEATDLDKHDFHPHFRIPVEPNAEYDVEIGLRPLKLPPEAVQQEMEDPDDSGMAWDRTPPLAAEGVARFGFEGEPPEGWGTEERRSLAAARLAAEIEDGEPEPFPFAWGLLIALVLSVLLVIGCLGGFGWALWKTFS